MIKKPKGATKEVIDYKLSRYACYLIVQNASPVRHKSVALGQTYFAVQTRKMEITQEEYSKLSEDEKRLYTRINVKNKNKYLFDTAKNAGVTNYGKFNDYGYKGLYNGETARRYSPKDFEYTIRLDDGSEEPLSNPDQFIQFSNEDKAKMVHAIITELPLLDTEHLKEVYNTLKNDLSKGKK